LETAFTGRRYDGNPKTDHCPNVARRMSVLTRAGTYPGRVRRRRLPRWSVLAGGALIALIVLALFWIGFRAAQAQHAMSHASDRLQKLRTDLLDGDSASVTADVVAIKAETA